MIKNFFIAAYRLVNNLKLIQKLLLSYLILIILPLSLLSYLLYSNVTTILEGHVTYSAKQSFDQTYSFLSYKLLNILLKSNALYENNHAIELLENPDTQEHILNQMQNANYLVSWLLSIEDKLDISRVRLYLPDDSLSSNNGRNIFSIRYIQNAKWYKMLKENEETNLWIPSAYLADDNTPSYNNFDPPNKEVLSLTKKLKDPMDYDKDIGIIRLDFPKKSIVEILNKANTINNSLTYIRNSAGEIVATSNEKLLSQYKEELLLHADLSKQSSNWTNLTLNNETMLASSHTIENTDWAIVTILPFREILAESNKIRGIILVLLTIISAVAFIIAYLISVSITRRIKQLESKMRGAHKGELEVMERAESKDEIGMLINEYNSMVDRITRLVEEQYWSGQELKNAELKALQAQINPHFLYNTLDMINWYAWKNKSREIISVVNALAKFYKMSLNKGKDVVTIHDELEHVLNYFNIQNMRFKSVLQLNISVSEEIRNCAIPKITLQPIVENAIFHGIMSKEKPEGSIWISAETDSGDIVFQIRDDGAGMSNEAIEHILDESYEKESEKGSGYGIKNINNRLKILYGDKYGLTYRKVSEGTLVEVRIPFAMSL